MPGPEGWATPAASRPETGVQDPFHASSGAGGQSPYEPPRTTAEAGTTGDPGGAADPHGGRETGSPGPEDLPGRDGAQLLGGDIPFRPLGISEMLDGAISSIRRNPRAILGLSLAIAAVIQLINSVATYFIMGEAARDNIAGAVATNSPGSQPLLSLAGLVFSAYGTLLLAGLSAPILGRTIFGMPASLRVAWQEARPSAPRLIVVAAAVVIASLLGTFLPLLPFVLLAVTGGPPTAGILTAVLGFPVALVLTLWLYVLFVLAVPAVVFERQGVLDALRRAVQLSRGRWWRTFGTLVLTLLITIVMGFLALRLPFLLVQLAAFGDHPRGGMLLAALSVDTVGRIVSWSLVGAFDAGVIVLLYADRRMRREGFDLEFQTRATDNPTAFMDLWRPSDLVPPPGTRPATAPERPTGYRPLMTPGVPGGPVPGPTGTWPAPPPHRPMGTWPAAPWPGPPGTPGDVHGRGWAS